MPEVQKECDVVVPRSRIAEYVKAAKRIALSHGIRVEPYGHCGDGNIHTELLRGSEMSDEEWKKATHANLTELYALSKELGGKLSGEHGIGNGRIEFLVEFVGPRMIQLYKAINVGTFYRKRRFWSGFMVSSTLLLLPACFRFCYVPAYGICNRCQTD